MNMGHRYTMTIPGYMKLKTEKINRGANAAGSIDIKLSLQSTASNLEPFTSFMSAKGNN